MEKKDEGYFNVGTSVVSEEDAASTIKTIEEEDQPASDVVETVNTCNHLNSISDNNLNSPDSPIMTKSPTQILPHLHNQPLNQILLVLVRC